MTVSATQSILTSTKGAAPSTLLSNEEENKKKVAYMGPQIGNLLNGSQKPPSSSEAAAIRA